MRVRFSPFTLVEILISLALAGILLTALMGMFSQVTRLGQQTTELRKHATARRYAQARISQVIHRSLVSEADRKQTFFYSTPSDSPLVEGQSLVFSYDNGAARDPRFSNAVLGRLFIDERGRLCLASWPLPVSEWQERLPLMRKEVLLESVHDLRFEFFYPQIPGMDNPFGQEDFDSWPKDIGEKPVFMSVFFHYRGQEEQMHFALPNSSVLPKLGEAL